MIATRSITVTIGDRAEQRTETAPDALALVDWARELVGIDRTNYAAHRDARVKLGAFLWQVKAQTPHGEFTAFVEAIGVKSRTAQHAMAVAAKVADPVGKIDWGKVKALVAQAKASSTDLMSISFNRLAEIAGVRAMSGNANGRAHLPYDPFAGLDEGEASGEWRVASGERPKAVEPQRSQSTQSGVGATVALDRSVPSVSSVVNGALVVKQLTFADLYAAVDRAKALMADLVSRASVLGMDVVLGRIERAEAALGGR